MSHRDLGQKIAILNFMHGPLSIKSIHSLGDHLKRLDRPSAFSSILMETLYYSSKPGPSTLFFFFPQRSSLELSSSLGK